MDLTEVIAYIETGGKMDCELTGLSGEKGCFQFLPSTWEAYSKEVLGYIAEQTPENEVIIAHWKIKNWLEKGYSDREIFLIWNQGNSGPCKSGVNRHGVAYDSCAYAEKALILTGKVMHR